MLTLAGARVSNAVASVAGSEATTRGVACVRDASQAAAGGVCAVGVVGTIAVRIDAGVKSVGDTAVMRTVLTLAACGRRTGEAARCAVSAMGTGAAIVASVGVVCAGQTATGAVVVGPIAIRINAGVESISGTVSVRTVLALTRAAAGVGVLVVSARQAAAGYGAMSGMCGTSAVGGALCEASSLAAVAGVCVAVVRAGEAAALGRSA
jgi:hypothetical protein